MIKNSCKVELIGGMFVEASAKWNKRIEEAFWCCNELNKSNLPYDIVAGVDLTRNISSNLKAMSKLDEFRGFRHIMNFKPNIDAAFATKNPF
jgi:ribosomal protein S13